MFVKIYSYRLKSGKEQEYFEIQKEAERLYANFIKKQTLFLQSNDDRAKWQEIHIYHNEKSYIDTVNAVDKHPEIQVLYKRFLEVTTSLEEILEENYQLIDFIGKSTNGKQEGGLR